MPRTESTAQLPAAVAEFLAGRRIAVAGVSRDPKQTANAIYRKLRDSGYEVVPVNPRAPEAEGVRCFPSLAAVPGELDGVVVVTAPAAAAAVVRDAHARGIRRLWFHRSFGAGSVSPEALALCAELGIEPIVGGCPFMYLAPVDFGHRCMRWWLARSGRVPVVEAAAPAAREAP